MTELEDLAKRICDVLDDGGNLLAGSAMHSMLREALNPLPDGDVEVEMKCRECGHIQIVKGVRGLGRVYFGSGYDFCDKCDGLPVQIMKDKP